jgi:hypothetical protein
MSFFARNPHLVFAFNGTVTLGLDNLAIMQRKVWTDGKSDAGYTQQGEPQFPSLVRPAQHADETSRHANQGRK